MEKVYLSNKTFLSDLCARALYHPRVHVVDKTTKEEYDDWLTFANFTEYTSVKYELKLYLKRMSTMTEQERSEYEKYCIIDKINGKTYVIPTIRAFDWLNENNYDYRGLIPLGWAIEVTRDNNPYETE